MVGVLIALIFFFFSWNLTGLASRISAISVMFLLLFSISPYSRQISDGVKSGSFSKLTLLFKISSAFATDLSYSCFLWVVQMLLPMGKTMLYFFEIYWLNSYPAVLTVRRFPFSWLGCWQVLDNFQYIPSKYWCFALMTSSELITTNSVFN